MIKESDKKDSGKIVSFYSGVAKISGLPRVFLHEVLLNEDGDEVALVIGFDERFVEALFFSEAYDPTHVVYRSREIFSIRIRESIVGRVLNGLGEPLDGFGRLRGAKKAVFGPAPQIIDREPVTDPLTTGIKIVDTTLPLGRGQRELIIGDRKLGKSTLALDAILNQKNAAPSVRCIYVLCGKKEQRLNEVVGLLDERGAMVYSTVVGATAGSSYAELYLAPFVGCAIGEFFRDQNEDALIVYDDLTQHAKAYRDIGLLLERPPGREAYPGDIFSLHALLLERAARLAGGGSLTALPIVETQEGDITSYIPTNLISITDGQIYFERGLFQKGFLPAVNVGLSVSRVGAQAQPPTLRAVTGALRLSLAQHKELQKLAQLETTKSKEAMDKIRRGELLLELLKQDRHTKVAWEEQVILFYIVEAGYFDDLPQGDWRRFESLFLEVVRSRYFDLVAGIRKNGLGTKEKDLIAGMVKDFKEEFVATP